jgi:hypothetical protein
MKRKKKFKHSVAQRPDLTEEKDWAAEIGLTTEYVAKARKRGCGAAYIKIGRKIYYTDEAKREYLKSIEVQPARVLRSRREQSTQHSSV